MNFNHFVTKNVTVLSNSQQKYMKILSLEPKLQNMYYKMEAFSIEREISSFAQAMLIGLFFKGW